MGGHQDVGALAAAHVKRARQLSKVFPPGTLVTIEWDYGPEFGNPGIKSGTGIFVGTVDEYDQHGWVTAYSESGERYWAPCGKIRMKMDY